MHCVPSFCSLVCRCCWITISVSEARSNPINKTWFDEEMITWHMCKSLEPPIISLYFAREMLAAFCSVPHQDDPTLLRECWGLNGSGKATVTTDSVLLSIHVCFYCTCSVFGLSRAWKIKPSPSDVFQMVLNPGSQPEFFCVHNSMNFDKIPNTTGCHASPRPSHSLL